MGRRLRIVSLSLLASGFLAVTGRCADFVVYEDDPFVDIGTRVRYFTDPVTVVHDDGYRYFVDRDVDLVDLRAFAAPTVRYRYFAPTSTRVVRYFTPPTVRRVVRTRSFVDGDIVRTRSFVDTGGDVVRVRSFVDADGDLVRVRSFAPTVEVVDSDVVVERPVIYRRKTTIIEY